MFQIRFLIGFTGFVAAISLSLLPYATAQIIEPEIQIGQATPGNSTRPVAQTNFQGRGVAQGSAFTRGRMANAALTIDGSNFGLELLGAPEEGTRAQVQYRGTVIQPANGSTNSGSFTLDGRLRSFTSSANPRVLNTTGTCRIEVFNSLVSSVTCNTASPDSSTRFLGLEQF